MAQVMNHKIDGQPFSPMREVEDLTISAVFGLNVQPELNITSAKFTNTDEHLSSSKIRELFQDNPIEGANYSFEVADDTYSFTFDFYFDNSKLVELSDSETEIGLIKDRAINSLLDFEGADVTMGSLEYQNIINNIDFVNIPYVVHNRKTILEKANL